MNKELPVIKTSRLSLRPFTIEDASLVKDYLQAEDIYRMTERIPYPYTIEMAENWIKTHRDNLEKDFEHTLAIVLTEQNLLIGAISILLWPSDRRGEIGYWLGMPYWGQGYATEAAKAIISYGFHGLNLNRIQARHKTQNRASCHVLEKLGMKKEGVLKQFGIKDGMFYDIEYHAILRKGYKE